MKIKYCVGDIVHIKDTFYNGAYDLLRVIIKDVEPIKPYDEQPNDYEHRYWVTMDNKGFFPITQAEIIELK